ncbi:MAG: DUF4013 domain-containing protein [Haloplanus sp.]
MTPDLDSPIRPDADEWLYTLFVGALLVATAPLVVPSVLLAGYAVRLLETDFETDTLPTFAGVRSLAAAGSRAAVVVAAYHLPPVALVLWGVNGIAAARYGSLGVRWALRPSVVEAALTTTTLSTGVAAVALGVALLPVCGYLTTIAVTAYAATGDVTDAFAVDRLRPLAFSTDTLRAWLLASLVVVASGIVAFVGRAVTATIPGVGAILVGAVRFYGFVFAIGVWNAYRPANDARDVTGASSPPTADTASPDST